MPHYSNPEDAVKDGHRNYYYAIHCTDIGKIHTDEEYLEYGYYKLPGETDYSGMNNLDLWEGGVSIDTAISDDSSLQIGSAIMAKLVLKLNNVDGRFNNHSFKGNDIYISACVKAKEVSSNFKELGHFVCTESKTSYGSKIITLTCYDLLYKLDTTFTASTNIKDQNEIVNAILDEIGLGMGSDGYYKILPRNVFTVKGEIANGKLTNREIIAACAEISYTYAQMTLSDGRDSLKFIDFSTNACSQAARKLNLGASLDEIDSDVKVLSDVVSIELGMEENYYNGVRIKYDEGEEDAVYEIDANGSCSIFEIEDNPFINPDNVESIARSFSTSTGGNKSPKAFYKCSASIMSNPWLKAGTPAVIKADDGKYFTIIVTRSTFVDGSHQRIISASKSTTECMAVVQSEKEKIASQVSSQVTNKILPQIENNGLYITKNGTIYYLHDQKLLVNSTNVVKFENSSIYISMDGGSTYTKIM